MAQPQVADLSARRRERQRGLPVGLPQSLDSERLLICAVIEADGRREGGEASVPDVIAEIDGAPLTAAFSGTQHRQMWEMLIDRHRHGLSNNLVAVAEAARERYGKGSGAPGAADLTTWLDWFQQLQDAAPAAPWMVKHHAARLRDTALRREKIREASELLHRLATDPQLLAEWFDPTAHEFARLPEQHLALDLPHHVTDVIARIDRVSTADAATLTGVPSGLTDLDRLLGGFQREDLIVIAGRPSMGKTAFALTGALHALQRGFGVGFVSCEMSAQSLLQRWLAQLVGVDLARVVRGPLTATEVRDLRAAAARIARLPAQIVDDRRDWPSVADACGRMIRKGADLLIVDYLGLMSLPGHREARHLEIGTITREAKALAKRYKVPLLLASQINREIKDQHDKRPQLWHLRDSGSIEQDSDVVIMLHREAAYDNAAPVNEAELLVRKFRNGPTGLIKVRWFPETARFANAASPAWERERDDWRE